MKKDKVGWLIFQAAFTTVFCGYVIWLLWPLAFRDFNLPGFPNHLTYLSSCALYAIISITFKNKQNKYDNETKDSGVS